MKSKPPCGARPVPGPKMWLMLNYIQADPGHLPGSARFVTLRMQTDF